MAGLVAQSHPWGTLNLVPIAMRLRPLSIVLVSLTALSALDAQVPAGQPVTPAIVVAPEGVMQRIVLRDGSEMIGRITSIGPTSVQFESSIGVTTIPTDAIVEVKEERGGKVLGGRYYFPNPNSTRLIFAPTGRMLPKGEGYFSDYWIFFPGFAAGLSDRVTIGGGMTIFPGVNLADQVLYFTPKVGVVQSQTFNAAVGALMISVPEDGFEDGTSRNSAGLLYGVGTWGGLDNSFTAGLGYGYANGDLASNPAIVLGGETRSSPRTSLVTENYILPGGNMMFSGGIRFMGRGLALDFALVAFAGEGEGFCCAPFLGFVYNWK